MDININTNTDQYKNCIKCKHHVIAKGNCNVASNSPVCDKYIEDTEESLSTKLIRHMKEPYLINQDEGLQIMCEMIEIFNRYGISEYYKFIIGDYTYCCYDGLKKEKLNPKDWDSRALDYGFNIIVESMVWYMIENDADYIYNDIGIDDGRDYVECMRKLRRVFRRHGLVWELSNYGCMVSFRKNDSYGNMGNEFKEVG